MRSWGPPGDRPPRRGSAPATTAANTAAAVTPAVPSAAAAEGTAPVSPGVTVKAVPKPETVDIVGNIPYYLTSDIVLRILGLNPSVERAVIMVQREVADPHLALPGVVGP